MPLSSAQATRDIQDTLVIAHCRPGWAPTLCRPAQGWMRPCWPAARSHRRLSHRPCRRVTGACTTRERRERRAHAAHGRSQSRWHCMDAMLKRRRRASSLSPQPSGRAPVDRRPACHTGLLAPLPCKESGASRLLLAHPQIRAGSPADRAISSASQRRTHPQRSGKR